MWAIWYRVGAREKILDLAKNTADYTKESYNKVSQKFKEEPAKDILIEGATVAAVKSAEYSSKVYNAAKEKVSKLKNTGSLEDIQNQAYSKAKTLGSSFWGFIWNVTNEDKAKMDSQHQNPDKNPKIEDFKKIDEEKPLFGFTWGK